MGRVEFSGLGFSSFIHPLAGYVCENFNVGQCCCGPHPCCHRRRSRRLSCSPSQHPQNQRESIPRLVKLAKLLFGLERMQQPFPRRESLLPAFAERPARHFENSCSSSSSCSDSNACSRLLRIVVCPAGKPAACLPGAL